VPVLLRNVQAVASLASMLSFFPSSYYAGQRLLKADRFDLIHSSFAVPSGPSAVLLARRFGLPHVLSIHGGDIWDPSKSLSPHRVPLLKQTVRWVMRSCDRVIAQSRDTVERAETIYRVGEVGRIPLSVRRVPFEKLERGELQMGLGPEHRVLITIGRLVARKGVDRLIAVVARQADERVRLIVVGDGPARPELEAAAHAANVAHRVLFTGPISDERKWQLLTTADLYVSTTLHEGFGIVFLEAMESGLPVICYDRGGQTDFLTSAFSRLVPAGDETRFERELCMLCDEDALRAELGGAARSAARDFHADRFAERYLEVYHDALAARA
jgi:glycosyltransferase involved in cell wall biosynthesis